MKKVRKEDQQQTKDSRSLAAEGKWDCEGSGDIFYNENILVYLIL